MERESGYYWVKVRLNSDWEVANYSAGNVFYLTGNDNTVFESELYEIAERRIVRNDELG